MQQVEGVVVGKVLKLQQQVGAPRLQRPQHLRHKGVKLLPPRAVLLEALVVWVCQQAFVVGAHV
jgi:hypothetical protein